MVPHGLSTPTGVGPQQGVGAERRFRFELAAHPDSPAQARRLTKARLNGWSVCEDTCGTAALVVSGLVTNAIMHTAGEHIGCEPHDGTDLVRTAVRDEGCAPSEPHPAPARPEEEHGRGLLRIDALCHAWGAQEHGSGLVVWADLPRRAAFGDVLRTGHGPRNDLGWGARPKPGPPGGPGDDEAEARHDLTGDGSLREDPRPGLHRADGRPHHAPAGVRPPCRSGARPRPGPARGVRTPDELLATGGVYAELYCLQAEQFTTRVPAPKAG